MSVQTFNPTSQSQSVANWAVAQRVVGPFAPHAQVSPDLTIALDPGYLLHNTNLLEVKAQVVGSFTPPVSGFRIDRVVIDRVSGSAAIVTGSVNSLTPPALPAGTLPVARVFLTETTAAIANDVIVDERALSDLAPAAETRIACRAHRNGVNQSGIVNNVWTKVALTHTDFNVGGAFDTANSRFQPSKEGHYLIGGQAMMATNTANTLHVGLYLNGVLNASAKCYAASSFNAAAGTTALVYLNGTTDYVELCVNNTNSSTGAVICDAPITYFMASLQN
ncbi:hypothetical protein ABAZ39_00545 [Azospirillum argentinense]|uniref:Uncharacterized protein n=1 Tax=Azospirillum argentinense TaxID=2970906 RepID=A0A060DHU6_9PROT|nr:hypothetical protein [Azospirillum argentinense]AIB10533.1 hypothetical protein ABAZ39_00545 [Azospirillum argentinense]EZQ09672.1 hypothetical protein ABAZ39_01965 [Azospirillum argentinense]PNQ97241.1 hypothetical protein C1S70_19180 [Azospirillum argentinense]